MTAPAPGVAPVPPTAPTPRPRLTTRQILAFGLAALGVAVGGFAIGARGGRIHVPLVTVGARAPDFRARTLDVIPAPRRLADYDGEVVLLNLWATWCGPCKAEMPSLEQLHRDLEPRGLHVVAVAVDDPGYEDRVRAFIKEYRLTFEVLSEGSGKIEADYQSRGIPSTYLIDRDGVIRMKVLGAADWGTADVRRRIEAVLRGDDPEDDPPAADRRSALGDGDQRVPHAMFASNPSRGSRFATPARSLLPLIPSSPIPSSPAVPW